MNSEMIIGRVIDVRDIYGPRAQRSSSSGLRREQTGLSNFQCGVIGIWLKRCIELGPVTHQFQHLFIQVLIIHATAEIPTKAKRTKRSKGCKDLKVVLDYGAELEMEKARTTVKGYIQHCFATAIPAVRHLPIR